MREAQQAEVLRDMSCNVMSHRGEIENDDLEEVPGSFIQEDEARQIVVQWWAGTVVDVTLFCWLAQLATLGDDIWKDASWLCLNACLAWPRRKVLNYWKQRRSVLILLLEIVKYDHDNSKLSFSRLFSKSQCPIRLLEGQCLVSLAPIFPETLPWKFVVIPNLIVALWEQD